jgi:hypothetical protein
VILAYIVGTQNSSKIVFDITIKVTNVGNKDFICKSKYSAFFRASTILIYDANKDLIFRRNDRQGLTLDRLWIDSVGTSVLFLVQFIAQSRRSRLIQFG